MFFLFFVYFFGLFGIVIGDLRPEIGECGNPTKNYFLNPGEAFMVQSPNFPKDLIDFPYIDDVKCDMTFTRSDGKDYGLYFIFTNGYTFGYNFSSPNGEIKQFEEKFDGQNANADDFEIYDSNSRIELYKAKTSISFGYGYGSDGHSGTTVRLWSAFQAFVYAPESVPTTNCWMNGQTFDLTDDKKIIPLFSQQIFNDYENCSWTVTVPLTMNMKLTIPKLFMPEGTVYQAKVIPDGGTPINVTEGMSREFSGYSFVIQFIASESAKEFNPDFIGFFGLVTAVFKANQSLEPLRFCRVNNETSTKSRLLSNDPNHGYNNNGICTASIPKEPNVAIVLQATYRFMEYLADKIEVFENDTESEEFSLELVNYDAHVYEGENDLSVKFLSDKNIVGAGFVVTWVQTPCECANETFVAPCQGSTLMPIMPNDLKSNENFYTYCQSMACRYEIVANPECTSKKKVSLKIATNLKSKYDVVILSYNNKRIWNSSDGNATNGTFDLSNMLEVVFLSAGIGQQSRWTKASNILVTVSTV